MTTIHNIRLDKDFTVTYNKTPEIPGVSWGAKGLLWYILSRSEGWEIHVWQLAKIYTGDKRGNGKPAVSGFITELKEAGYLLYTKYQKENGQWEHRYDAYPLPVREYQEMFPQHVKPALVKPALVEPALVKRPLLPSTELPRIDKEERGGEPPQTPASTPPKSSKRINRKPKVSTTEVEHLKLLDKHTEAQREEAYQTLSDWKEDTPKSKWKKCDYRSINRWVFDAIKEKKLKGTKGKSRANTGTTSEQNDAYKELF